MTIMDKINSNARAAAQTLIDKEPLNYLEAGSLYGIIAQGRHTISVLSILHNQAQDPDLKALIKEAIDDLVSVTISECEDLMRKGDAQVPQFTFSQHPLENHIDIPNSARLTDMEIAATMGTLAKFSQITILSALLQSYQLEIGLTLRRRLDAGLDWNYRLLELMLNRGWLPHISKVTH